MSELITEFFSILLDCFKYDISVFSQPWIYYCIYPSSLVSLFLFREVDNLNSSALAAYRHHYKRSTENKVSNS